MPNTENNDTGLEWGTPPVKKTRTGRDLDGIAAELRARPGQWACVERCNTRQTASGLAYSMRIGIRVAFLPKGAFEAVVRSTDGTYNVWARYVGGDPS